MSDAETGVVCLDRSTGRELEQGEGTNSLLEPLEGTQPSQLLNFIVVKVISDV